MHEPINAPYDHPAVVARGVSRRQLKRLHDERKLTRYKANGRQSAPMVNLGELDDHLALGSVPVEAGPLVEVPGHLLESVDALARLYDGRPGSAIHRLLCAIVERIDEAIWE